MKRKKAIEILVRGVCIQEGCLLVCRSKGAANTYLPGGHLEWGEKAAAGLRREIREELGVRAVVGDFLGAVEHTFIQKGERHCEINLVFRMEIPALSPGREPAACEHWIDFRWIPMKALGRYHLEPHPLRVLLPAWATSGSTVARWGGTLS